MESLTFKGGMGGPCNQGSLWSEIIEDIAEKYTNIQ